MTYDYKSELRPLPKLKNPKYKKWIGFDCETYSEKNLFYMVTFYSENFKKVFYDKKEAVKFIKKFKDHSFVASNLMFDYTVLFDLNHFKKTTFVQSGSLYIKLSFVHDQKKVEFHDTLAFFQASVEKLGEIIGVPKLDPPFKLGRKPINNQEKKALEEYCMRDSEISYRFMLYLQEAFKKEGIKEKNTISGIALELFKRKYLDRRYKVEPEKHIKLIFKSYYGGRTEVFKRGSYKDINYYDFNSLYPSCMEENEFPDPNTSFYVKQGNINLIKEYAGVTTVKIHIPKCYIPILPYRKDDKLLFPCGTLKGTWTNLEINHAIKYNNAKILECYEGVYYTKMCRPFKKFVNDVYSKRLHFQKKKDPIEKFYKTTMNSLYGKFSYRYFLQNDFIPIDTLTEKELNEYKHIIDHDLLHDDQKTEFITIINKEKWGNPPSYLINIWSSYITSYARLKLYSILGNKELQPYICYCDTDSVMLHSNKTLPTSNKLGDLKLEGVKDKAIFIRPKMYIALKPRIKGVKGKLTEKLFYKILHEEKVDQQMFTKFRTALKSRPTGKYGIIGVNQIIEKEKKLNFNDTKRLWDKRTFKHGVTKYTEYYKPQDSRPFFLIDEKEE